jgi:hypothetical protein
MIKHVVAAGCSFTQCKESWAHRASEHFSKSGVSVYNNAIGGTGNYIISTLCISQIKDLLDRGAAPEEIFVVVQWSGIFRNSFLTDASHPCDSLEWFQCYADNSLKRTDNKKTKLTFDAGRRKYTPYWANFYQNYWSDECAFVQTLENVLRTQWFLKSQGIAYRMICGWDIFTDENRGQDTNYIKGANKDTHNNPHQWDDGTRYSNSSNSLLKDTYAWSQYLWDLIDFNAFEFFENDAIKLGGILQWVQHNLEPEEWYVSKVDHHPSWKGQERYFNEFLLPKIERYFLAAG